jgi:hypothetical protein
MDILQQLGTALGIGLLSGIRLYLTILGIGSAIRFHWITLAPSQNGLSVLADWRVMLCAGIACAVEFIADKVPWVDSAWDSVHTFIRPVGAVILGARAFMHTDPAVQAILAILCGGLALSSHSAKAATRFAVNHSPEPFSNIALSVAGDMAVPIAGWAAFQYPRVMLVLVGLFTVVFAWLAPRVFRAMHVEVASLAAALSRWFGGSAKDAEPVPEELGSMLPRQFVEAMRPLPQDKVDTLRGGGFSPKRGLGVHSAATRSVPGLNNSLGYLLVSGDQLVFVTRRLFRTRTSAIALSDIRKCSWSGGLFADRLNIWTNDGGERRFDILRPAARETISAATTAVAS